MIESSDNMRQDKWYRAVIAAGNIGTCGDTADTFLSKIKRPVSSIDLFIYVIKQLKKAP